MIEQIKAWVRSLYYTKREVDQRVQVGADALAAHAALTAVHGATGAVVGTTNTQTLTNKTLTAPKISTISNTGTLTLPTATDTLVGRATTDTLTNKTLTSPTITGATSLWSELATALAAKLDKTTGTWTTSNWTKAFTMSPGTILLWLKGSTAQSRGIGYTTDGNLYVGRSTADDNSASITYDMVLDNAGNLDLLQGTIATASGDEWDLAGYTGGAVSVDGYLTVTVNGTPYKIPVESA